MRSLPCIQGLPPRRPRSLWSACQVAGEGKRRKNSVVFLPLLLASSDSSFSCFLLLPGVVGYFPALASDCFCAAGSSAPLLSGSPGPGPGQPSLLFLRFPPFLPEKLFFLFFVPFRMVLRLSVLWLSLRSSSVLPTTLLRLPPAPAHPPPICSSQDWIPVSLCSAVSQLLSL